MFAAAKAPASSATNQLNISAVLNGYYQSEQKALSNREKGFGLGETELALSGNIDDAFYGKMTTVLVSDGSETEVELEEAFIQTMSLPAGFSIRGGRFLSDIGYLNSLHMHTDAFTDRPAVYRAFLGGHYFDDGLRLDYVAPTDLYWSMGVEALKGANMRAKNDEHKTKEVGIYTAYTKFGGDINDSSSWMMGLSYLNNQNGIAELHHEEDDDHGDEHKGEDKHSGHDHGAKYTGKNLYGVDAVYKWAPNGNFKYQHFTLSGEYFRMTDLFSADEHQHDLDDKSHQGWYVSGVYQWSPKWSTGLRYGRVDVQVAHEHEEDGKHEVELERQSLKETEFQISYHHSHFSTIRLQYTNQQGQESLKPTDEHSVTLQFIMTLGAHSAHQF
nr:hypothetical protein [Parashewanella tropica]